MSESLVHSKRNRKQFRGFIGQHKKMITIYIWAAKLIAKIQRKPMYININMDHEKHALRKLEITGCLQELVFPKFLSNEIKWIGITVNEKSTKSILNTIKTI